MKAIMIDWAWRLLGALIGLVIGGGLGIFFPVVKAGDLTGDFPILKAGQIDDRGGGELGPLQQSPHGPPLPGL